VLPVGAVLAMLAGYLWSSGRQSSAIVEASARSLAEAMRAAQGRGRASAGVADSVGVCCPSKQVAGVERPRFHGLRRRVYGRARWGRYLVRVAERDERLRRSRVG
jgi:hypothetical protein